MKNFYLKYFRHNQYGLAYSIPSRPISYYELTLVLDGEMEYRINDTRVMLFSGDAVFVRVGEQRMRPQSEAEVDYVSFNFYCDGDLPLLPVHLKKAVGAEIRLLLAACDAIAQHTREENNRRRSHILKAILCLLGERSGVSYSPLTESILLYLHKNLSAKVTLGALGEALHFSPVYCDTVFKRETGKSIIAYLLDERMEEAKRLLQEGTMSPQALAAAVGFEDYNYFARCFKKRVGYSPLHYRRIITKSEAKRS